jgi:hypothetical protein
MPIINLNIGSALCVEFLGGTAAPEAKPESSSESREAAPAAAEVPPDELPF